MSITTEITATPSFSRRSKPDFQSQFLATILRANTNPNLVTFAGGNPNSESFPVSEMSRNAGTGKCSILLPSDLRYLTSALILHPSFVTPVTKDTAGQILCVL